MCVVYRLIKSYVVYSIVSDDFLYIVLINV